MAHYLTWNNHNYAANLFNVRQNSYYAIPKPKFLFFVDFKISTIAKHWLSVGDYDRRICFMTKTIDRPNYQFQHQELNQYNKKKIVTTGVTYGSVTFTLHDTVDELALRMVKDYGEFYYHDFSNVAEDFRYDVIPATNHTGDFGYNPRNGAGDIHFFESLDVYEFYNSTYTKYRLMNPRMENVTFDPMDMAVSEGSAVTLTFKPEGVVYEEISAPITASVSELVGLPFQEGTTGNYRFEYPQKTVGEGLNSGQPYEPETPFVVTPFIEPATDIYKGTEKDNVSGVQSGTFPKFSREVTPIDPQTDGLVEIGSMVSPGGRSSRF